jgi:hypothetical protein
MLHIGPYLGTGHTFHPGSLLDGVHRAVASMYSWGGGGGGGVLAKKFRIFHGIRSHEGVCYPENEDAIYKQKYAYFTHRHITESSMQRHRKFFLIVGKF